MGLGLGLRSKFDRLKTALVMPRLAKLVDHMARTGQGTDECLKAGSLPLPVHFYSPVPDVADLDRRDVWTRTSDLGGIEFRPEEQVRLLKELGERYGLECDWPLARVADERAFHLENLSFSYGCAAVTHSMIRRSKPRRVVEVGSGFSSRVISAALRKNELEGSPRADYTIFDPLPGPTMGALEAVSRIVPERVELQPATSFDALTAGDILFVDSGHTVRIAGDVNFIILDVLPRLAPGVIVHFHDIAMPYEYQRVYYTNPAFRVFWTESYLLQAFLAFNTQFEVSLALSYLMTQHGQEFAAAFPRYDRARHKAISGSFWITRSATS